MSNSVYFSVLSKKILTRIAMTINRFAFVGGILMFAAVLIKLFLFLRHCNETFFVASFFAFIIGLIAGCLFSALLYTLSIFFHFITKETH